MSMFPKPQISQPYSKIDLMNLLKSSNCISTGKSNILILWRWEKRTIFESNHIHYVPNFENVEGMLPLAVPSFVRYAFFMHSIT